MNGRRASRTASTAITVFAICISARMFSCMRAPPDAATDTNGTPWATARSVAIANFSPTDAAHRAAEEAEVHHREHRRPPADHRRADDAGVAEPGRQLGIGQPLGVRLQVDEGQRIGGAQVGADLDEGARVGQLLDALAGPDREVVAALAADAQGRRELVVAVVGTTDRARVRVSAGLLRLRIIRAALYVDRDLGH